MKPKAARPSGRIPTTRRTYHETNHENTSPFLDAEEHDLTVDIVYYYMNASSKRKRDGSSTSTPRFSRTSGTYGYDPLPTPSSIRILELQPGEKPSIIACKLSVVERDATPLYEALSYAWGRHNNTRVINCEGQKLKITANLRDALWSIRDPVKTRLLWVDAICINQHDDVERAHQVRQMPLIYTNAVRVLVWLNLANEKLEEFEELFDFANRKGSLDSVGDLSTILDEHVATLESPNLQAEALDEKTALVARLLSQIFDSPWFLRLWVVQEVGMAKSVAALIGSAAMDFVDLIRFILRLERRTLLMDQLGLFTAGKATVFTTFPARSRELSGEVDEDYDFLEMLEVTRAQMASDPRDYVYALLGHPSAQVDGIPIIEPDYSITSENLFLQISKKIIGQTQSLRILSAVHHTENTLKLGSPSWVPLWSRPPTSLLCLGVYRDHYYDVEYDASASKQPSWEVIPRQNLLRVQGFVFDKVRTLINEGESNFPRRSMHHLFFSAMRFKFGKNSSGLLKDLAEIGQTITAGFRNKTPAQFTADFAALRLHLIQEASSEEMEMAEQLAPEGIDELEEAAQQGNVDEIYWAASRFCSGRKLFSTHNSMLGLGPSILRDGDRCCILFGAPVPFILRPVRGDQFQLVGEAYVQGVMKGEAMVDWMLGEKFQQQTFELM